MMNSQKQNSYWQHVPQDKKVQAYPLNRTLDLLTDMAFAPSSDLFTLDAGSVQPAGTVLPQTFMMNSLTENSYWQHVAQDKKVQASPLNRTLERTIDMAIIPDSLLTDLAHGSSHAETQDSAQSPRFAPQFTPFACSQRCETPPCLNNSADALFEEEDLIPTVVDTIDEVDIRAYCYDPEEDFKLHPEFEELMEYEDEEDDEEEIVWAPVQKGDPFYSIPIRSYKPQKKESLEKLVLKKRASKRVFECLCDGPVTHTPELPPKSKRRVQFLPEVKTAAIKATELINRALGTPDIANATMANANGLITELRDMVATMRTDVSQRITSALKALSSTTNILTIITRIAALVHLRKDPYAIFLLIVEWLLSHGFVFNAVAELYCLVRDHLFDFLYGLSAAAATDRQPQANVPASLILPALNIIVCFGLAFMMGRVPIAKDVANCMRWFDTFGKAIRGLTTMSEFVGQYLNPLLNSMHLMVFGTPLLDEGLDVFAPGLDEWLSNVRKYVDLEEHDTVHTNPTVAIEVSRLYHAGLKLSALVNRQCVPEHVRQLYRTHFTTLTALYKEAVASGAYTGGAREEPFVILLHGEAGTGKSHAVNMLSLAVLAHLGYDPRKYQNLIYNRRVEQEFWDGYTGQPIVSIDDFLQRVDSVANPNLEVAELINMVSTSELPLHMADLAEKSCTKFMSKVIILTSNHAHWAIPSITTPEAFYRRFHCSYHVSNPERFTQVSGNGRKLSSSRVHEITGKRISTACYRFNETNMFTSEDTGPEDALGWEEMLEDVRQGMDKHFGWNATLRGHLDEVASQLVEEAAVPLAQVVPNRRNIPVDLRLNQAPTSVRMSDIAAELGLDIPDPHSERAPQGSTVSAVKTYMYRPREEWVPVKATDIEAWSKKGFFTYWYLKNQCCRKEEWTQMDAFNGVKIPYSDHYRVTHGTIAEFGGDDRRVWSVPSPTHIWALLKHYPERMIMCDINGRYDEGEMRLFMDFIKDLDSGDAQMYCIQNSLINSTYFYLGTRRQLDLALQHVDCANRLSKDLKKPIGKDPTLLATFAKFCAILLGGLAAWKIGKLGYDLFSGQSSDPGSIAPEVSAETAPEQMEEAVRNLAEACSSGTAPQPNRRVEGVASGSAPQPNRRVEGVASGSAPQPNRRLEGLDTPDPDLTGQKLIVNPGTTHSEGNTSSTDMSEAAETGFDDFVMIPHGRESDPDANRRFEDLTDNAPKRTTFDAKTRTHPDYPDITEEAIENYEKDVNEHRTFVRSFGLMYTPYDFCDHDRSKFLPYEAPAYIRKWTLKNATDEEWDRAVKHHYAKNPHHPEHTPGVNMDPQDLAESVVDMFACVARRVPIKPGDVVPDIFFDVEDKYLERYTTQDRKTVKGLLSLWKSRGLKYVETPARYYKVELRVQHVTKPQGLTDQNSAELRTLLLGNMYVVTVNGARVTNGLMVNGRTLLVNQHSIPYLLKQPRFEIRNVTWSESVVVETRKVTTQQLRNAGGRLLDATLMQLPPTVNEARNITKHFVRREEHAQIVKSVRGVLTGVRFLSKGTTSVPAVCQTLVTAFMNTWKTKMDDGSVLEVHEGFEYRCETQGGDCGSPLTTLGHGRPRILGIHQSGGCDSGGGYGAACSVCFEEIEAGLQQLADRMKDRTILVRTFVPQSIKPDLDAEDTFPEGVRTVLGTTDERYMARSKTKIRESAIHGANEPTTAPTQLFTFRETDADGNEVVIDPLKRRMKKYITPPQPMEQKFLTKAALEYGGLLQSLPPGNITRVLTLDEAVSGIPGEEFIGSIVRNTSAGYGWKSKERGKFEFLGTGEVPQASKRLRESVEQIIDDAKENVRFVHPYVVNGKDERKNLAEEKWKNPRCFQGCALDYLVCVRMYFMAFVNFLMTNRVSAESCVGVNAFGDDWKRIVDKLRAKSPRIVAGDYSNYDGTLNRQLMTTALELINDWYTLHGGSEEDNHVRRVLFMDICSSVHVFERTAYQTVQSMPSGNPLTAIINSVMNSLLVRYAYFRHYDGHVYGKLSAFGRRIAHVDYGDDNLTAVPEPDDLDPNPINAYDISRHLASAGFTYTDDTKHGASVPYKSLDDVNFLKRGFVFNAEFAHWDAPLALESIREMCNWIKSDTEKDEWTRLNVETAMRELSYHTREVYARETAVLLEACRKVGIRVVDDGYDESRLLPEDCGWWLATDGRLKTLDREDSETADAELTSEGGGRLSR